MKNWDTTSGMEPKRQADQLGIVRSFRDTTVVRITFDSPPKSKVVTINGKVKCHGCQNEVPFTIVSYQGLFGGGRAFACLYCSNQVDILEQWDTETGGIFICVSPWTSKSGQVEYPLTILINEVTESNN